MQELKQLVIQCVVNEGKYLPVAEISKRTGIDLLMLYRVFPEGIKKLMNDLGYFKEVRYSRESLEMIIRDFIRSIGRSTSGFEIANELKISRATLAKYKVDVYSLNSEEGFPRDKILPALAGSNKGERKAGVKVYVPKIVHLSTDEMIEAILSIIESSGHYCSTHKLGSEIGVSSSTIVARGVDTTALNASLGFTRNNRCFESEVGKVLGQIFEDCTVSTQKWFKDCLSDRGFKLYFDFYIPELKILVEADGPCHSDKGHPWYTEAAVRRDAIKKAYCEEKKIPLVRIPYAHKITKEYIKKYLPKTPLETAELQHS